MTRVDGPATRRLRAHSQRLRRYLLFERFTLIDPDEMRRRRVSWPIWRRALRPIGAACFWTSGLFQFANLSISQAGVGELIVGFALLSGLVGCVVLGVGLEWRDRRREGRPIIG